MSEGVKKYVLDISKNRSDKTFVDITPELVRQELINLKISIQYYMGYGDLSYSDLMNKYLDTSHNKETITTTAYSAIPMLRLPRHNQHVQQCVT